MKKKLLKSLGLILVAESMYFTNILGNNLEPPNLLFFQIKIEPFHIPKFMFYSSEAMY